MANFQLFLLILQLVIAVVMIVLVLLQKSDGDSLGGIGGGSGGGANALVSSKTSANILSKATMVLIGIFMLNCLILASLSNASNKAIKSDLEKIVKEQEAMPDAANPAKPTIPAIE
jgi:preprotein translocase subunit SecG